MDLFSLQCFIEVSENKSFTKSAQRLGRTQSAISQQISKIESYLGYPLLVREKVLQLTPNGEIFLGYARKIFTLHCEMIDRFKKPELVGEVRFGLPEDFATLFLSEILADFTRLHPRISLLVECDLTLNLFKRFKANEFDLVLVKMNSPADFPHGHEVWSEPLRWVGHRDLIKRDQPVPLVLAPKPCVYREAALNALEKENKTWRVVFTSPSYAGTIAAVKAKMGITIMPSAMIPNDLKAIDPRVLPPLQDTHVSLLKHQSNVSSINSFEEFVMKKLNH